MFRPTTIVLPIAVMAFAIVAFLLLIDLSIYPPAQVTTNAPVKNTNTTSTTGCRPTGCSSQVCSDQEVVSTCEFRSEYACYKNAVCERQASGECGWTMTPTLTACIEAAMTGVQDPTPAPTGQVQGVDDIDESIRPELY